MPSPRLLMSAMLAACAMLGASCTFWHPDRPMPAPVPAQFTHRGTLPLPDKWWLAIPDEKLHALIDEALAGNFSLAATWDRLAAAQATARKAGAPLWPALNGTAGAARTRTVSVVSQKDGTTTRDTVLTSNLALGLAVSYELDIWGRVRSARQAAAMDLAASGEDLSAAAITLSAQVADTWYQLLEQQQQLLLLGEQVKTNQDALDLVTLRFRRGQVSAADVLQQRQLLEGTQGEIALTESTVAVLRHALAILLGRAPTDAVDADATLIPMPPLPETGLPAALVQRRPDVRSAQLQLAAADRRVGAAIADQFPKISLTAGADTSAMYWQQLFDNWIATMAANMVAPLFDAGLRKAEVDRTKAVASERLHLYGQTVLTALGEVEDALVTETRRTRYVESLSQQLDLSRQAVEQNRLGYTKGTTDFLRYLDSQLSYQQLQRTELRARRELVQNRIRLYRALGGGWTLAAPADRKKP